MSHESLDHLRHHHGDFDQFAELMVKSAPGRFGPIWWGIWDQHVQPADDAVVVDLGSGPGGLLGPMRDRHPAIELVAVEIQPAMLAKLRPIAAATRARIVEADLAGPLPLADASADVVVASMLLHELEFPPGAIAEAFRILRPGGIFFVYDWVKQPLDSYLGDRELTPDVLAHFREHCLYTPSDLAFLLERAGFAIRERIGRRSEHFVMLVAERPE